MSHHSADYESAAADLVEYYGQPIFYCDKSLTTEIPISASVHPERSERRKTEHGWTKVQIRDVFFDAGAVTARMDGTVRIGEAMYSIDEMGTREGGQTKLALKRVSAGEISRPRARG